MGKHRAGGGAHADRSRGRARQLTRRASRLTVASSLLLPMPVAVAVPQSVTLSEELLGTTRLPVTGIGNPARGHVAALTADEGRHGRGGAAEGLSVSVTRLGKIANSARTAKGVKAEASAIAANGIPAAALRAYRTAEATMNIADPSCGLTWGLLAGIGRIESDHGRFGGAVLGTNGVTTPHILGLPLNGTGATAAIADTDHGTLDGDQRWDRAVGPMQFIPSTWSMVGVDGDGNGKRNPHDIDDAALAAAAYLCVGDQDLTTPEGAQAAVYSYNHSTAYVALVLGVAHAYQSGAVDLPLLTATLSLPTGPGTAVGLTPGEGVAIGATDEVAKPGAKNATNAKKAKDAKNAADAKGTKQTKPGATKGGEKADPKAGDKAGDKTQKPTGGNKTTDPADGNTKPGTKPGTGGDDSTKPGKGKGGSDDPVTQDPPTTDPPADPPADPPTDPPTDPPADEPADEPIQDIEDGTLVWCDDAVKDELCLEGNEDDPLVLTESQVESYESMVGEAVTVIYGSTDGSDTGAICGIEQGKVEDPEC